MKRLSSLNTERADQYAFSFSYLLFSRFLSESRFFLLFFCMYSDSPIRWAPRERHDVTYVSRLQSVKAAVDAQLEKMEREQPNRKVGIG